MPSKTRRCREREPRGHPGSRGISCRGGYERKPGARATLSAGIRPRCRRVHSPDAPARSVRADRHVRTRLLESARRRGRSFGAPGGRSTGAACRREEGRRPWSVPSRAGPPAPTTSRRRGLPEPRAPDLAAGPSLGCGRRRSPDRFGTARSDPRSGIDRRRRPAGNRDSSIGGRRRSAGSSPVRGSDFP